MYPRKLLYLANSEDNVATALGELEAGETVPIVAATGEPFGELTLKSHVPRFFKVAIRDLEHKTPILKWGQPVGRVSCAVFDLGSDGGEPGGKVEAGTIVHVTNFSPSSDLMAFWGGSLAAAANRFAEIPNRDKAGLHPFELGKLKKEFATNEKILISDLQIPAALEGAMFPRTGGAFLVGRALRTIPVQHHLHLGCVEGQAFRFPGNKATIDSIRATYRFLKGKIHAISEDVLSE